MESDSKSTSTGKHFGKYNNKIKIERFYLSHLIKSVKQNHGTVEPSLLNGVTAERDRYSVHSTPTTTGKRFTDN